MTILIFEDSPWATTEDEAYNLTLAWRAVLVSLFPKDYQQNMGAAPLSLIAPLYLGDVTFESLEERFIQILEEGNTRLKLSAPSLRTVIAHAVGPVFQTSAYGFGKKVFGEGQHLVRWVSSSDTMKAIGGSEHKKYTELFKDEAKLVQALTILVNWLLFGETRTSYDDGSHNSMLLQSARAWLNIFKYINEGR